MKIAVLSSHTPSLLWFRLDMMKDFINAGHAVIALGPGCATDWKDKFGEYDIDYRQLRVERNGINPLIDLQTFWQLREFMKNEKPDKVFAYQAKTVIYGSIAAKISGIAEVYLLIAGLGSVCRGTGLRSGILKTVMKVEYWIACRCSKRVFFHNDDDKREFISNRLVKGNKTETINGSGVNLRRFQPSPFPNEAAFLFVGRLIKDKGVLEYLEACRSVKLQYPDARCLLVGPYDTNPSSLSPEALQPYLDNGVVEYFGEQDDVRPFISQCSVFVLPSYHEGTPKTVLEAMAMGRPIITSNAPGCKEAVIDSVNGYLVDIGDVRGLADKMMQLITSPGIGRKMGAASVRIAEAKYDVRLINQSIMKAMDLL